jgi:hypothetical protein
MCRRVQLYLHAILNFIQGKILRNEGFVRPTAAVVAVIMDKNHCFHQESKSDSSVVQPVA